MSYDVYGIGNALVDMEYVVDDSFLRDHDIAKGHMTLVDEKEAHSIGFWLPGQEARQTFFLV